MPMYQAKTSTFCVLMISKTMQTHIQGDNPFWYFFECKKNIWPEHLLMKFTLPGQKRVISNIRSKNLMFEGSVTLVRNTLFTLLFL